VIATACKDYRVRIYHLKYSDRGQLLHSPEDVREIDAKSEVRLMRMLTDTHCLKTHLSGSSVAGVACGMERYGHTVGLVWG
jgi:hypothetical protein